MIKPISFLFILFSLSISAGCAVALVGAGAAGIYAISDDTVEAIVKNPPDSTYHKALKVMKSKGNITSSNSSTRTIEGNVNGVSTDVWIGFDPKTGKGSKITVKSRSFSGAFPNLEVAKKTLNDIMRAL